MPRKDESPALPDPRADISELRTFVAVARLGAVGRAARVLGRTQPSISARLAGLERSWSTRLFRRGSRGMILTPEGSRLLPLAESVLRELGELDRAAGVPIAPIGELRVGAGDALGRRKLPHAVAKLLREDPGLDVTIREGPGPGLIEALRSGEIDVALIVRPSNDPVDEGLDVEPLFRSEVHVLAPRGELGAGKRSIQLQTLAGRRLVTLQRGSGFRRHLEAAFERAGVAFRPAVEVGNLSLVRRFVATGVGVAPVPAVAFSPRDQPGLERRRMTGIEPLTYASAVRRGAPLPPAATRLLELLGDSRKGV